MTTSFPRSLFRAILFITLVAPAASIRAQVPAAPSLRNTPNEIERNDPRVTQIIESAERHFKQGQLNLDDNRLDQARDEFDKAVDSILESGLDVRSSQRLQTYYLELVERIYRLEVPTAQSTVAQTAVNTTALIAQNNAASTQQQPAPGTTGTGRIRTSEQTTQQPREAGFRQQKFEPSPLDDLAKLVLTPEEQNVNPEDLAALGQARSAIDFNFTINPLIQQFINYYQGRGRSTMETGLRRSGRYMRMARRIFREEGVPEDIAWLGQVESAWRPMAFSSAAASGLWQFVPGTGRQYGLRQTAWVDERNSIEQSTRASAHYLKWLANRYNGNWELAMAAYNTGEGNVDRAIQQAGTASFWAIYPYIAQETRNYVPNILATILIAKQPDRYGFRGIRPDSPLAYDVVKVPSATSLQLIADIADTSVAALRELNPQLRRDITPRGEAANILIPAGKARQLQALLRRVPLDRRETARMMTIAPGEDLQAVAERTGTSLAVLQQMNGGADTSATNRVVVPNNNVRSTIYTRAHANTDATAQSGPRTVKARAGDTIAKIAQANRVSADEVARLNGMTPDTTLQAGQVIILPASAPQQQQSAPAPRRRR
ncbi:MAG: hypothetical protein AUG51_02885 [Acidobacteria bacterium 13_1_20CM_3_53_8]|nr:MAG: hypothetical protein AUG51_02885 [Acidobacteria bacterium 13_1_20CM_3_53_8]